MKAYTAEQSADLGAKVRTVLRDLEELRLECAVQAQSEQNSKAKEHLAHGAGRRVTVMRRAITNIFTSFPPETDRSLDTDALADAQINLHAFVINLSGIFDNWAWAFVHHHGLLPKIADKRSVGMFTSRTTQFFPDAITNYLASESMIRWQSEYLKNYRDALAHRIPLYIPPSEFTKEAGENFNRLEMEKTECIKSMAWERLEQIYAEQAEIGTPSFSFLHSFSEDDPSCPVLLHPQVLSDAMLVVEFGQLFFRTWRLNA